MMKKISVNGVTLAYVRRGKGAPLMLIHGYPLDHSIWNEIASSLEGHFDLILPDMRGFGQSTTIPSPYSVTDIADDFAGLLDHLGLEKVALAGHSMGGYIALAFAGKYPNRVSGLALVSSQIGADTPERKAGRYKTADEVAQKGVGVIATAMTEKLSPNLRVREFVRPLIEAQSKDGIIGALKAMAERKDSSLLLPTFQFPVVLIHGDADELIPIEGARDAKAAFPFVRLVELQGAGHMPMMDAPEKTAEALKLLK